MDPLSTSTRSSYETLRHALATFMARNRSYRFEDLEIIVQTHGWTLADYNDHYDMELAVRKLKGLA